MERSIVAHAIAIAAACGPIACLRFDGNRLLGWFLVGGTALAATAHHLVFTQMRRS